MFTGLVEEVGVVEAVEQVADGLRLTIASRVATQGLAHGDSISVSGVCLTAVAQSGPGQSGATESGASANDTLDGADNASQPTFTADVMAATLTVSTLGTLAPGDRVNLERALTATTKLGGHIVQGHVDGQVELLRVTPSESWRVLRFSLPRDLAPLLVNKGSVTLAGVSLTVSSIAPAEEEDAWFEVSLIPETLTATTLGELTPGDRVNIETDILARQVARMLQFKELS